MIINDYWWWWILVIVSNFLVIYFFMHFSGVFLEFHAFLWFLSNGAVAFTEVFFLFMIANCICMRFNFNRALSKLTHFYDSYEEGCNKGLFLSFHWVRNAYTCVLGITTLPSFMHFCISHKTRLVDSVMFFRFSETETHIHAFSDCGILTDFMHFYYSYSMRLLHPVSLFVFAWTRSTHTCT